MYQVLELVFIVVVDKRLNGPLKINTELQVSLNAMNWFQNCFSCNHARYNYLQLLYLRSAYERMCKNKVKMFYLELHALPLAVFSSFNLAHNSDDQGIAKQLK